jgi:hypothetical protein
LSNESALQLDIAAGDSFTHKSTEEGEALLSRILENTPPLEPLHVEPMSSHEEVSLAKAEPVSPTQRLSPEPEGLEEGFQPSDLPYFEDDFFEDYRNTLNYSCQKRPPMLVTPLDPLDEESLRETARQLTRIMSYEWVEEAERSSKEIHSSTIQCKVGRSWEKVLYNPTVGANLMFTSYALAYLGNEPFAPTNKTLRLAPRSSLEGAGVLHGINLHHDNTILSLDFHVFDIQDFDMLIGHPLENFS